MQTDRVNPNHSCTPPAMYKSSNHTTQVVNSGWAGRSMANWTDHNPAPAKLTKTRHVMQTNRVNPKHRCTAHAIYKSSNHTTQVVNYGLAGLITSDEIWP